MTTELIDGFADTPHVSGADRGALTAGILGDDNYVVNGGNQFAATMRDANHITISTGEAVMGGRHIRVTAAEDVTITSGSQGLKRHDIVGLRYTRSSPTPLETASLEVIKGTASSTPADPTIPSGNLLTGASTAFMPLYRVPLDGITVGTPVPLFNVLKPMSELWDSVTQSYADTVQTWNGWRIATHYTGVNLRHLRIEKTYGSRTDRFDAEIAVDLPVEVPYPQRIPVFGSVASSVVSYGNLYVSGRRAHLSFYGYGGAVTIIAEGLVYVA